MKIHKSKKSNRKTLRDQIGKLQYAKLLRERGPMCEICKRRPAQGRFHILSVGSYPRLEFCDENVLLACWLPCHYTWHHDYRKAREIDKRIKELRGEEYEINLKALDITRPKLSTTYLHALLLYYKEAK